MSDDRTGALVDRLSRFDRLVEIGIGERTAVATALAARGCSVTATDIIEQPTLNGVTVVVDDVTAPTVAHYEGAELLYGLRLPPELQRPTLDLARRVGAECWFTTLGGDPAVVSATPEQLPGTTLYRATEDERGEGAGDSPTHRTDH